MATVVTNYTITDKAGKALCHSPNAHKRNADATRKRAVADSFLAMVRAAGMVDDDGMVVDVHTGRVFPMADAMRDHSDLDLIERGHVVPDSHDGPLCPCNLVPEWARVNRDHGEVPLTPDTFTTDPRTAWREVWVSTAKASKVARMV